MTPCTPRHRGTVLLVVLLFVGVLSLSTLTCLYRISGDTKAINISENNHHAYAAAMSGIQRAIAIVSADPDDMTLWYDNPGLFENQLTSSSGGQSWYYTVYAFDSENSQEPRYGLIDEAAKINLATADADTLGLLPWMTDELIDALLDYQDGDDQTRPNGAEQDYYDGLDRPYLIPNGPLASIEELLMVRGFSGQIVYGEDVNFNGLLDANESDGENTYPPDNGDGVLDRGLADYLTTYTTDPQIDSQGQARIPIGKGYKALEEAGLPLRTLQFIYIALKEGKKFNHPAELLEATHELKNDYDGINARKGDTIESGVGDEQLPIVLDLLTCNADDKTGRVNLNTASAATLAALPGLDENIAQQIVDARASLDAGDRQTVAWLYTQGLLDAQSLIDAAPYLTTRSRQFRVRVVGYGLPCKRYQVLEAVIDLGNPQQPRIAYLRDLTRYGLPFAIDTGTMEP